MHAGGERRERQRPRNEWSEEKTEKEEKGGLVCVLFIFIVPGP